MTNAAPSTARASSGGNVPLVATSSAVMGTSSVTGSLPVAAALFCFSAGPVGVAVQKLLVASFSPFLIIAVQMTLGAVVLWALRLLFPPAPVSRSAVLKGLALGALHPGAFMIVYTTASVGLDSVTAVLLLAIMPALVAIGGRLVLKEALKPVVLVGIGVSIVGLAVLVSERQVTGENTLSGFVLGVLGLALAAGGVIAGRAFNTGAVLPWFLLAPLQVTGAAIVAWTGVLVTAAMAGDAPAGSAVLDPVLIAANWLPFLYLGFGMTAASYFAYNFALSRLPTPTIGLLSAAGPGVGALAAALIFGTAIGPIAALGITVILFGTALPPLWGVWSKRGARHAASPAGRESPASPSSPASMETRP